jgi:hypothetical protein
LGFPATQIPDLRLCGRSPVLVVIFGALSPHPKIPFPAAGLERGGSHLPRLESVDGANFFIALHLDYPSHIFGDVWNSIVNRKFNDTLSTCPFGAPI